MGRPRVLVAARCGPPARRGAAVAGVAWMAVLNLPTPAAAQTAGLESPSLWLLIASVAQIVAAAGVVVFFITRGGTRRCGRCGQRMKRDARVCPRCGSGGRNPAQAAHRRS